MSWDVFWLTLKLLCISESQKALFVLLSGAHKGVRASKFSMARWIRQAICEAYWIMQTPPLFVNAHSTWVLSTSWVQRTGATLGQICRAATWSRFFTFVKHYCWVLLSVQDKEFCGKVLQVPPRLCKALLIVSQAFLESDWGTQELDLLITLFPVVLQDSNVFSVLAGGALGLIGCPGRLLEIQLSVSPTLIF